MGSCGGDLPAHGGAHSVTGDCGLQTEQGTCDTVVVEHSAKPVGPPHGCGEAHSGTGDLERTAG